MASDDRPVEEIEQGPDDRPSEVSRAVLLLRAAGLLVVWLVVGVALLIVLWLVVAILLSLVAGS